MSIREKALGVIRTVFKRHGAVALSTPVFELKVLVLLRLRLPHGNLTV